MEPQEDEPTHGAAHEGEAESGGGDAGDAEVWQSFEQSVAYMTSLSALYKDAFSGRQANGKKSAVSSSHVEAAKGHAREAVELLASNLLNAATAIVSAMDHKDEQLIKLDDKLGRVKQALKERQDARERQAVRRFLETGRRQSHLTTELASADTPETDTPKAPRLSLMRMPSTNASGSSYLLI